jgi:HEPN domain-containing protein
MSNLYFETLATRRELQQLACLRLEEAEALYNAGCYDGCAYLCGYVVELALKAAICATLGVAEYPEKGSRLRESFKTHDFDDLKLLAGMESAFTINSRLLAKLVAGEQMDARTEI